MSAHFVLPLQQSACSRPEFEFHYEDSLLSDRVSREVFEGTIRECNRIMLVYSGHGLGCVNWGCVCFPLMMCVCVKQCRLRRALREVKVFLRSECQRVYLSVGVSLQLEKNSDAYIDMQGVYHPEVRRHIRVDVSKSLGSPPPSLSDAVRPPSAHASLRSFSSLSSSSPTSPLHSPLPSPSPAPYGMPHGFYPAQDMFHPAGDDTDHQSDQTSFMSSPQDSFATDDTEHTPLCMPMPSKKFTSL